MNSASDLISVLSKVIVDAADEISRKAKFDRTSIGIVTQSDGDKYTVAVFGGTYVIQSSQSFSAGQRVAVTAPQNDFKHLILRAI